jgi:TRAP-type mannitol/chloroaromatic compound transport system permease small subunit
VNKILRAIDATSGFMGGVVKWFCYVLILVMVYDVTMRYLFDAPTMWAYETAIMLGAAMYALAWSYTHLNKGHVRVDAIYTHFSPRGKALIDVIGAVLFFLPLAATLIYTSAFWTLRAWRIGEVLTEGYWYPPLSPLRTVILIGVVLFALQGSATIFRDVYFLIKNKPYD